MFYIPQQYPCISPLPSLSLPQNKKSSSLLSQLPFCLGTGKYTEIPESCSKAQHLVNHPAHLLLFLNYRWEGTGEKGWPANFQIRLSMFFSKIPHCPDERLKETDTHSSVQRRKVRDRPQGQQGLAGLQVTYPAALRGTELLAAGRHLSAEPRGKINSHFCGGQR